MEGGLVLNCPYCNSNLSKVINVYHFNGKTFRQRNCKECLYSFHTIESNIDTLENAKLYTLAQKHKSKKNEVI